MVCIKSKVAWFAIGRPGHNIPSPAVFTAGLGAPSAVFCGSFDPGEYPGGGVQKSRRPESFYRHPTSRYPDYQIYSGGWVQIVPARLRLLLVLRYLSAFFFDGALFSRLRYFLCLAVFVGLAFQLLDTFQKLIR